MIKLQKQAFKHNPDAGIDGDCTRTCVAMLLDVPRDCVPHEHGANKPEDYNAWKEQIARTFGVKFITIALPPQEGWSLADYCEFALHSGQGMPLMLGGFSGNETNHSVVIDANGMILDPAIDNSGIHGPCDDGFYWLEWIVRPLERAA